MATIRCDELARCRPSFMRRAGASVCSLQFANRAAQAGTRLPAALAAAMSSIIFLQLAGRSGRCWPGAKPGKRARGARAEALEQTDTNCTGRAAGRPASCDCLSASNDNVALELLGRPIRFAHRASSRLAYCAQVGRRCRIRSGCQAADLAAMGRAATAHREWTIARTQKAVTPGRPVRRAGGRAGVVRGR